MTSAHALPNMRKAEKGFTEQTTERALVLGDSIGIALSVARSLGRRGVEVHLVTNVPEDPSVASEHVAKTHRLPSYSLNPIGWLDALHKLVDNHRFQLIIPCDDSHLLILRHHANEIGQDILAIANEAALAMFTDKLTTRKLAADLGIAVAHGKPVNSLGEAEQFAQELGFPIVLKPSATYALGERQAKTMARIVRDHADLAEAGTFIDGRDWIAEAYILGDSVGLSVIAENGEITLAWQHRRLAVASETGASSARTGEQIDENLLADVQTLVLKTRLTGVAMFEFRVNQKRDSHVLLEVNPRFWGSLPLALAAGADFPAALWDVFTGSPTVPAAIQTSSIIKRNVSGEYQRIVSGLENTKGPIAKLIGFFPALAFLLALTFCKKSFDSWTADDPRPFHFERRQIVRRLQGALHRRLRQHGRK